MGRGGPAVLGPVDVKHSILAAGGGGGGGGGGVLVVPTSGLTLGSSYDLLGASWRGRGPYLRLLPYRDFSAITADQDAIASPHLGWSWANSGALSSATYNPTGATGELQMVASGAGQHWGGVFTAAYNYKTIAQIRKEFRLIARLAYLNADTSQEGIWIQVTHDSSSPDFFGCGVNYQGSHVLRAFADSNNTNLLTTSQAINEAGVWFMVSVSPRGIRYWYDTTNDPLPPHRRSPLGTWTIGTRADIEPINWGEELKIGFLVNSYANASANHTARVLYYEDTDVGGLEIGNPAYNVGHSTAVPEITLLADRDIGATATLTDADVRAAFQSAENLLPEDSGSWEFSAVRSAGLGAAASAWASSSAVSVQGAGQYVNLFARATSDGRQAASLHAPSIVIPYS